MKHKLIAVALITFLICMVSGSSVACTTPVTEYVLDISSTEGGSVTEPGEGKFPYCQEQGERVNLVATPDAGYRFVNWTGDVDTIADVNDATTTMTMNDDYSITANFEEIAEYELTISGTEGGSVTTPGEGTFIYDRETVLDLVAEADEGYQFDKWTGDVGTIDNVNADSTTITVNGDYSIRANFIKQYELTISSTQGGSVTTPGEGKYSYDRGEVVNLVATPDVCYRFVSWTGDVGTVADVDAATTTITMNNDYSITAKFTSLCD
jgi:uncharacterized repeat protein (TIGR02543 family)